MIQDASPHLSLRGSCGDCRLTVSREAVGRAQVKSGCEGGMGFPGDISGKEPACLPVQEM